MSFSKAGCEGIDSYVVFHYVPPSTHPDEMEVKSSVFTITLMVGSVPTAEPRDWLASDSASHLVFSNHSSYIILEASGTVTFKNSIVAGHIAYE